jgi:hypothetical protein
MRDRLGQHEDYDFQCEGYYGDGTQLYRHRVKRSFMGRYRSLSEAHAAFALAHPGTVAHHPV